MPSKPFRITPGLNNNTVAGQVGAALRTTVIFLAYQADVLKNMDKTACLTPETQLNNPISAISQEAYGLHDPSFCDRVGGGGESVVQPHRYPWRKVVCWMLLLLSSGILPTQWMLLSLSFTLQRNNLLLFSKWFPCGFKSLWLLWDDTAPDLYSFLERTWEAAMYWGLP